VNLVVYMMGYLTGGGERPSSGSVAQEKKK
jgi:hypothetical protein